MIFFSMQGFPAKRFLDFNYYYFEYVSLDWLEVLLEYYGNLKNLPLKEKEQLASSLKNHDASLKKNDYR